MTVLYRDTHRVARSRYRVAKTRVYRIWVLREMPDGRGGAGGGKEGTSEMMRLNSAPGECGWERRASARAVRVCVVRRTGASSASFAPGQACRPGRQACPDPPARAARPTGRARAGAARPPFPVRAGSTHRRAAPAAPFLCRSAVSLSLTSARPGGQDLQQQHHEGAQVGHVPHEPEDVHGEGGEGGGEWRIQSPVGRVQCSRSLSFRGATGAVSHAPQGCRRDGHTHSAHADAAGGEACGAGGVEGRAACLAPAFSRFLLLGLHVSTKGRPTLHPTPPALPSRHVLPPLSLPTRIKSTAPSGPPSGSARTSRRTPRWTPNSLG